MLNVIVKTVNVVTAGYVLYIIGGMIYELGKESVRKEMTNPSQTAFGRVDNDGHSEYIVIDGQVYRRVDF